VFKDRNFFGAIFKRSILLLLFKVLTVVLGFVFTVLITRTLSVEQSGIYLLVFTIVSVLSVVCRLGLDRTIVRFVAIAEDDSDFDLSFSLVFNCLIVVAVVGTIVSSAVYLLSDFIALNIFNNNEMSEVLSSMSISILGLSVVAFIAFGFQGMSKPVYTVLFRDLLHRLILVGMLVFLAFDDAVGIASLFSIVILFVTALTVLAWFIKARKQRTGGTLLLNSIWRNKVITSCIPLWAVAVTAELVKWSAQIISGAFVSETELAYFAVAQRVSVLTSLVLIVVNMLVTPKFAVLFKKGLVQKLESLVQDTLKLNLLIAAPVLIAFFVFPNFILSIYGDKFVEGALLLQILAVGQFVNVVTGSVGNILPMSGHEKVMRNIVFISGIFSVLISFILIPVFGVLGAAISTALSISFQNILAMIMVYKILGIRMIKL